MGLLAAQPNVAVKISGLGMADYDDEHYVSVRGCDAAKIEESIRPFVLETIEAFGVERCMLASNFPCAPRTLARLPSETRRSEKSPGRSWPLLGGVGVRIFLASTGS